MDMSTLGFENMFDGATTITRVGDRMESFGSMTGDVSFDTEAIEAAMAAGEERPRAVLRKPSSVTPVTPMSFQDPATAGMEYLISFHHSLMSVLVFIVCYVAAFLGYVLMRFSVLTESLQGPGARYASKLFVTEVFNQPFTSRLIYWSLRERIVPNQERLEVVWTVVPLMFIFSLVPASTLLTVLTTTASRATQEAF
jgi:hypothetical protein